MILRIISAIAIILSFVISGLFSIKHTVQNLNEDFKQLTIQLEQEKEGIRVLKAEWAYLNQPERLRYLSKKYLELDKIELAQIHNFENDIIRASAEVLKEPIGRELANNHNKKTVPFFEKNIVVKVMPPELQNRTSLYSGEKKRNTT